MQTRLDDCFAKAHAAQPALVGVPAGRAWAAKMKDGSGKALYAPDGSHPSRQGVYLAAAVFYSTFFHTAVKSVPADVVDAAKLNELAFKVGCPQRPGAD
jgi:hypothetical protein